MIAQTPTPPYYAVVFTSIRNQGDNEAYTVMAEKMEQLAQQQPGFLGVESARNELGITVSYWKDEESIKMWKQNIEHQIAQKMGRERWYSQFHLRVCLVTRDYKLVN